MCPREDLFLPPLSLPLSFSVQYRRKRAERSAAAAGIFLPSSLFDCLDFDPPTFLALPPLVRTCGESGPDLVGTKISRTKKKNFQVAPQSEICACTVLHSQLLIYSSDVQYSEDIVIFLHYLLTKHFLRCETCFFFLLKGGGFHHGYRKLTVVTESERFFFSFFLSYLLS